MKFFFLLAGLLALACILACIRPGLDVLRRFRRVARLAVLFVLAPFAAFAADTTVDLAPLIDQVVIPCAVILLGGLATWLSQKAAAWMGAKKDDVLAAKLEEAMKFGLAFAQSKLGERIGDGPIKVDVKSALVATAAGYAANHVPDTLKALGVGPKELAEKLAARLELNTTPADQSIAVPTPPG
jgi:hypothetical protein